MPDVDENGQEGSTEPELNKVKQWASDQFRSEPFQFLLVVIFISIVAAIVFVLIFSVVFDRQPWEFQGSVRTLLALAGASLITIFLSRNRTTLNSTIGIVLIGALIISTEDLLRFSLLFSGSDRAFEEFFIRETSRTTGQQTQNASGKEEVDISALIVNRLSAESLIAESRGADNRVAAIISQFLKLERNDRILSQLEQRAADRLFRVVVDGNFQEWNFRFGNQQKFQSDLAFLRSIGLISYVYGTPQETIEVTDLGRELSVYINTPLSVGSENDAEVSFSQVIIGMPARFNVEADGSWFAFEVESAGSYEINVASTALDPVTRLYADLDADLIAENDDGGFGLDSRIVTFLDGGRYFLNIRDYDLGPGSVSIDIVSYVPPQPVELAVGNDAVFGNVGLDGARFALEVESAGEYMIQARSDDIAPVIELYESSDFQTAQIISFAYPDDTDTAAARMSVQLNRGQFGLLVFDDYGETGLVSVTVTAIP